MDKYQYIIIGGGMTGSAAISGIRKNDADGSIAMFTKEGYGPYNRPPLTKGLWNGMQINDIMRPTDTEKIDLYLNTPVTRVEPKQKRILTQTGAQFTYEKLLLATGGHPTHLPDAAEGVIYFRTRADYEKVRKLADSKREFCVIGGGFIGSEIAAALTKHGCQVTMVFPEIGVSGRVFPNDLSAFLNQYYREKWVNILNGHMVDSIRKDDGKYTVHYRDSKTQSTAEKTFDMVIVGIGIKPDVSLAKEAGIETGNGILVNDFLQTSIPDIFAAGDVASFYNYGLGKRTRVEHEDNANKMGMRVGLNMSGEMEKYEHFPFFYSDLFELGYEALGELDKQYRIVEDWTDPFRKGTIYYLHEDKVRGLVFWNLWGKVDRGREIIQNGKSFTESELAGLFKDD
jgi:3-phenylpropionate/trans-cinnamate dioxygenase ferredoxin reductase subunit